MIIEYTTTVDNIIMIYTATVKVLKAEYFPKKISLGQNFYVKKTKNLPDVHIHLVWHFIHCLLKS